ncbi:hypothetical protein APHAL10511_000095 [Amanita phalloides]|nr:hypothetical protein APHAL10511_000095 [Amanita phalloides]
MPAFLPLHLGKRKQDSSTCDHELNARICADPVRGDAIEKPDIRQIYWMVQWRKPQYKKHKTWDGDGVLVVEGFKAGLYDSDGKIISSGKAPAILSQDSVFRIGDKEVEFDRVLTSEEYSSGACFASQASEQVTSTSFKKINEQKPFRSLVKTNSMADLVQRQPVLLDLARPASSNPIHLHWKAKMYGVEGTSRIGDEIVYVSLSRDTLMVVAEDGTCIHTITWKGEELRSGQRVRTETAEIEVIHPVEASNVPLPNDIAATTLARSCLSSKQNPFGLKQHKEYKPLHDPHARGAIVMKTPLYHQQGRATERGLSLVHVVLDPILANRMRPHQIEGVKFMYESVMGLRKHEGHGCILADEMGLGKSLQTIGLIWTMLKQNAYAGLGPSTKKVLLVCPVSLINNWRAEFYKWLGRDRVKIAVCDKDVQVAQIFSNTMTQQVLITGYERLRTITKYLSVCIPPVDLIICDEGHRLKSSSNKTRGAFEVFRTQRRIILSGTPIQNDLREFHAMVDFCNPGLLDDYATFRRVYEAPILKGRAPNATSLEVEAGKLRSAQLHAAAKSFVLRRDISVLQSKLPPKHEYVVFVTPTSLQLALYASALQPERIDDLVESSRSESLPVINMLVKISNSPVLLKATIDHTRTAPSTGLGKDTFSQLIPLLPRDMDAGDVSLSGKLIALSKLLRLFRQATDEKCIIVSHYTSTLNILEVYCKRNGYSFLRLDGQTPASKRQEHVDKFNKCSQESCFLFLLSSKAGGVGLNLTGASRLCLIDSDWNPSHDLQSMARCYRDGQKRQVFIYRLLTTGTIDEKIYQRQITKLGLSGSLIGDVTSSKNDSFTKNDLRDIFRVHCDTNCNTHDLLQCTCDGSGIMDPDAAFNENISGEVQQPITSFVMASQVKPDVNQKLSLTTLHEWKHFDCSQSTAGFALRDEMMNLLIATQKRNDSSEARGCMEDGDISFVFEKSSIDAETLEST